MDVEAYLGSLIRSRERLLREIARQEAYLQQEQFPERNASAGRTERPEIVPAIEIRRKTSALTNEFMQSLTTGTAVQGKIPAMDGAALRRLFRRNQRDISVILAANCCIFSNRRGERHAYAYMNGEWALEQVLSGNVFSVRIETDAMEGDARPLMVFLDENRVKISHQFFAFNVPAPLRAPDACRWVRLGFRLDGNSSVQVKGVRFGDATLYQSYDKGFFERIRKQAEAMPQSNGGRYYEKYSGEIGLIADEFLYDSFRDTADFVRVTPENYREAVEQTDFLLLASAWRGIENEWEHMTERDNDAAQSLLDVIKCYHDAGKKVVFYSKEDPPNYDSFVWIAQLCDIIFTSAEEMIPRYQEDCPGKPVQSLCFGINPRIHNPVGICSTDVQPGVIFSGSWMAKYPKRCEQLRNIFDGVLKSGLPLKIIDRNFGNDNPRYFFPEEYYSCVSPAIAHDTLQRVHKLYRWAININSVTDSRTMFANRVYELQAIGNLLLSNDSLGMTEKFPGVFIAHSAEETAQILSNMDDEEIYRRQIAGARRVMTGETTFDRLSQILRALDIPYQETERKIAVVVERLTPELQQDFATQTYANRFLVLSNELSAMPEADMVAFWDSSFRYGPHYLEDMSNGFKYTNCDYITKLSWTENGIPRAGTEHQYVREYRSKCASLFWADAFAWPQLRKLAERQALPNGYGIDHFELQKPSS